MLFILNRSVNTPKTSIANPFYECQISLPMSLARTATGLRSSVTNFLASSLISMTLFRRAKRGASGNEATNRETNPN